MKAHRSELCFSRGLARRAALFLLTLAAGGAGASCSTQAVESTEGSSKAELSADERRVLGFESPNDWTASSGTKAQSSRHSEGSFSLAMSGIGYSEIQSGMLSSLGPVGDHVSIDLLLPLEQPNQWWYGSLSVTIDCASQGIHSAVLGQIDLTGKPLDSFQRLSFALPPALRTTLSSGVYSDLRVKVTLNVPSGGGAYLLDRLDFGSTSAPPSVAATRCEIGGRCTVIVHLPKGLGDAARLVASESVLLGDRTRVKNADQTPGHVANVGSGQTNVGVGAELGDVWSRGPVVLRNDAEIGFARTLRPVEVGQGATLAGQSQDSDDLVPLQLRSWSVAVPSSPGTAFDVQPGGLQVLAPGAYTKVDVKSRSHVQLRTGQYFFDELSIEPEAQVDLAQGDGPVHIYVLKTLRYRGPFVSSVAGTTPLLAYLGSDAVSLDTSFFGTFVAPRATLSFATVNGVTFSGAFYAARVSSGPDVQITLGSSLVPTLGNGGRTPCAAALNAATQPDSEAAARKLGLDTLVNCLAPGIPACEATMVAAANMDRTSAAIQFMNKTFDSADYLALVRDRTFKVNEGREDVALQTAYCSGDQDGDLVGDSRDDCPDTPPMTPTDDRGCTVTDRPHAVPRGLVDHILATHGVLRDPRCDGAGAPQHARVIEMRWAAPTNMDFVRNFVDVKILTGPAVPNGCTELFEVQLVDVGTGEHFDVAFSTQTTPLIGPLTRSDGTREIRFDATSLLLPRLRAAFARGPSSAAVVPLLVRSRAVNGNGMQSAWTSLDRLDAVLERPDQGGQP